MVELRQRRLDYAWKWIYWGKIKPKLPKIHLLSKLKFLHLSIVIFKKCFQLILFVQPSKSFKAFYTSFKKIVKEDE